jgi:excisionase family DNA binding protein
MSAFLFLLFPAALAAIIPTLALTQRRIVTQQQAAQVIGVHVRTIRNWISQGFITGFRLPGGRAIRVDLDDIEEQLKVMPATMGPRRQPFGPKAKIVTIVEEYRPATDANAAPEAQDQDQDQEQAQAMAGGDR